MYLQALLYAALTVSHAHAMQNCGSGFLAVPKNQVWSPPQRIHRIKQRPSLLDVAGIEYHQPNPSPTLPSPSADPALTAIIIEGPDPTIATTSRRRTVITVGPVKHTPVTPQPTAFRAPFNPVYGVREYRVPPMRNVSTPEELKIPLEYKCNHFDLFESLGAYQEYKFTPKHYDFTRYPTQVQRWAVGNDSISMALEACAEFTINTNFETKQAFKTFEVAHIGDDYICTAFVSGKVDKSLNRWSFDARVKAGYAYVWTSRFKESKGAADGGQEQCCAIQ